MSDHCGTTTEEGAAVCVPGACSCSSEAKSNEPISLSLPSVSGNKKTGSQSIIQINNNQEQTMWKKIRSALAFGVACIASPCCTPIIVPIGLALLSRDARCRLGFFSSRLGLRRADAFIDCKFSDGSSLAGTKVCFQRL